MNTKYENGAISVTREEEIKAIKALWEIGGCFSTQFSDCEVDQMCNNITSGNRLMYGISTKYKYIAPKVGYAGETLSSRIDKEIFAIRDLHKMCGYFSEQFTERDAEMMQRNILSNYWFLYETSITKNI